MTPTERRERRLDIEGELKQARGVLRECQLDEMTAKTAHESRQRTTIAAEERLAAIEAEVKQLAEDARLDFLSLLSAEPPGASFPVPPSDYDGNVLPEEPRLADESDPVEIAFTRTAAEEPAFPLPADFAGFAEPEQVAAE